MPFTGVYPVKNINPRGKLYLHNSASGKIDNPVNLLEESIVRCSGRINRDELLKMDYFISILWSDRTNLLFDFFGYSLDDKQSPESNVGIRAFTIRDGIWATPDELTCGEGIILLGEEEKLRRKFMASKNLSYYLEMLLDTDYINKLLEFD